MVLTYSIFSAIVDANAEVARLQNVKGFKKDESFIYSSTTCDSVPFLVSSSLANTYSLIYPENHDKHIFLAENDRNSTVVDISPVTKSAETHKFVDF